MSEPNHLDPDIAVALADVPFADNTVKGIRDTVNSIINALCPDRAVPALEFTPVGLPSVPVDPTFAQVRDFCANAHDALTQIGAGVAEE